jgi:hypothetical protein
MKKALDEAFILLLSLLVFACEHDNINKELSGLSGKLISHSTCKSIKSAGLDAETPTNQSCVEYSFDASNSRLSLKHINAGFNCCPDSIYCHVSLSHDTIIISESEESSLCNCNCLFDLEIEVSGVEAQEYQIKFIEPYAADQEKMAFGLNLLMDHAGSYCVTRTQYPWGI